MNDLKTVLQNTIADLQSRKCQCSLPTLHEIAWALRVSEVKEDAAQRSLDWYNRQPPAQRTKTAWANSLSSARAILDLLESKAGAH